MSRKYLVSIVAMMCGLGECAAAVAGRALLVESANRTTPGPLVLCTILGDDKKFETLVPGKAVDAHFSPDGKQVVYGEGGTIKVMSLDKRVAKDLCPYGVDFTFFNWCADQKIYWSDGDEQREIFSVDVQTKERKSVHKGNGGRSTISLDGKRAAWVMPPVCAFMGGKTFQFMGGCGGSISPSGKFLTSNLTTNHNLIGIIPFDDAGPGPKPIAYVNAPPNQSINGFYFGRSDDWVCFTVEEPKEVAPIAYIAYWRTGDLVGLGKYCIKDFFDTTDEIPADAVLEKIAICSEGPTNTELGKQAINVGASNPLKVVGYYTAKGLHYTPQLRDGVTWKGANGKVAMTNTSYKGLAEASTISVTAEYKGKSASFVVSVLPELTGDGFKAEYFADATYTKCVATRVETNVDGAWQNAASPDPAIAEGAPWSARWTGMLDVQTDGDYVFSFLQGEGNDWNKPDHGGSGYGVWVDDKLVISNTGEWNCPWAIAKASAPIPLKKGMHAIKAQTIGGSPFPVVARLIWSGPAIKPALLGGGYVHSAQKAAKSK